MYSLFLLAAVSLLLAFIITPLIRNLFLRLGIVDEPDHRKVHQDRIPRIGGIPIAIAVAGAYGILLLLPLSAGSIVRYGLPVAYDLLPAAALIFLTGLLDDLFGLRPWQKLAGQLIAAAAAVYAGVQISGLAGYNLNAWLAVPLTVVWLIGCSNAFNLIDGVDGLAAGVGFFATLTMLIAALLHGNVELALATIPLAGALLGFLRYNFNPASIFLGDCGSLLVGFLLGCYGVIWSQKSATVLGMTAPLMALAIPLLDTGLAIARRFLRLQPIFGADRGHIHHRLLARGLTPRRVALILYGICGVAATLSLLQSVMHESFGGLILVLFCAAAWMGVQHLGYVEFNMASRMLLAGAFRRMLNAQLSLKHFEEELKSAKTPDECWAALRASYGNFGFHQVSLVFAGRLYADSTNGHLPDSWQIRIRLSEQDSISFSRGFGAPDQTTAVGLFADAAGRTLKQKLQEFQTQNPPKSAPNTKEDPLSRAAAAG